MYKNGCAKSNIGPRSKVFRYKMLKSPRSYSAARVHERVNTEQVMRSADVIINEALFVSFTLILLARPSNGLRKQRGSSMKGALVHYVTLGRDEHRDGMAD